MEEISTKVAGGGRTAINDVSLAFGLGWDMTYLFTYAGEREEVLPDVPDRLPSLSRLPKRQRSLIRLDRIRGPVTRFIPWFKAVGVRELPKLDKIEKQIKAGSRVEDVRDSLCDLHYTLMRAFSTADNRLAKAYRLGRSLATTCHAVGSEQDLRDEFDPQRLARLDEWLADLTSQFPSHTSRPVRHSLSAWRDWVADPLVNRNEAGDPPESWRQGFPYIGHGERPLDWERDGARVQRTLRRQGDIWRALLSGEKRGEAMLEMPNFIGAAQKIPRRTLSLLGVVLTPLAVSVGLACGGLLLALSDDGLWKSIVGFVALSFGVAGTVGFTLQGPMEGLRRSTAQLKKPLWGAVLDEEIAAAITKKPQGAIFPSEDAAVAAPATGPRVSV